MISCMELNTMIKYIHLKQFRNVDFINVTHMIISPITDIIMLYMQLLQNHIVHKKVKKKILNEKYVLLIL